MFRFEKLEIWQLSRVFVKDIYQSTTTWPKEEKFALILQIKRSVVSVMANIAEGSASGTNKDFNNFLNHSRKSLFETISHLIVAKDMNYINERELQEFYGKADILSRKITAFKKKITLSSLH